MSSMVVEKLLSLIREQKLQPGSRLPSARELANVWKVSRPAVNRAIHQMEGAGMLRRDGYRLRMGVMPEKHEFVVHAILDEEMEADVARKIVSAHGGRLEVHPHETMRKTLLDLQASPPAGILTSSPHNFDLLGGFEAVGPSVMLCYHEWSDHCFVKEDHPMTASTAVEHLYSLGHRQIACFIQEIFPAFRPAYKALAAGYRASCLSRGLQSSAMRIHEFGMGGKREIHKKWTSLLGGRRTVTAIVCSNLPVTLALMGFAAKAGIRVPEQLSVVLMSGSPGCAACDPPLTTVSIDESEIIRIAASLLCGDILDRARKPGTIRKHGVNCQPVLTVRASTVPPPGERIRHAVAPPQIARETCRWADDPEERRKEVVRLNTRRYPLRYDLCPDDYHPLDLSRQVNRALQPRSSWLGDLPLLHFEPGAHTIHGIPFRVDSGEDNPRLAAVVLRSARSRTSGGKPLPEAVTLPVGSFVQAVYFLHAAGWTYDHEQIASYRFRFVSGREEVLPIICYGSQAPTRRQISNWARHSIVQDWHPSMKPFSSERALPFVVTKEGDPLLYERYLYTCRWLNKYPKDRLQTIIIERVTPASEATLAVLGITLECPRPAAERSS